MTKVQCANCGLFTLEDSGLGTYPELNAEYRESGRDGCYIQHLAIGHSPGKPICLVEAFDLPSEIPDNSESSVVAVGHKERDCNEFMRHQRGLSPKEHREMKLLREVESINRCAQAEMLAIQRDSVRVSTDAVKVARGSKTAAWIAGVAAVIAAICSAITLFARH
jgi:hypothetical protein